MKNQTGFQKSLTASRSALVWLAFASGLVVATCGRGALVVQDAFLTGGNPAAGEYSTSVQLSGQDPTIAGWSGAWSGSGVWTNLVTGLTYSSGATVGTIGFGGAVQRLSGTTGVVRSFDFSDALTYSNTLWIRVLMRPVAGSSDFVLLRTNPGNNVGSLSPRWTGSPSQFQLQVGDVNGVITSDPFGVGLGTNGVNLIVLQVLRDAVSATNDVVRVWLNPTNALNDTNWVLQVANKDLLGPFAQFNQFFLNHQAGNGIVDEIAIGTTAADIGLDADTSPKKPLITSQPASTAKRPSSTGWFSVSAIGSLPLLYQWTHAGTNLPGATGSVLEVFNLTTNDVGAYQVVITNAGGATTSSVANLTLYTLPPSTALVEDRFLTGIDPANGEYSLAAPTLAGQNPVTTGFSGAWTGTGGASGAAVASAGLSYSSGATLGTLGYEGGVSYPFLAGGQSTRSIAASAPMAAATNLWLRLLMKPGTAVNPFGEFFFFRTIAGQRRSSLSPRWAPGLQNGFTDKFQLMITDWSDTRFWYELGTNSGGTHLVVMSVLRDANNGSNETVKVWFNPTAPLSDGNTSLIVTDKDFIAPGAQFVQIYTIYDSAPNSAFDEIGIATDPADLGLLASSAVVAPNITAQPQSTTNWFGDYAQFTVGYQGTSPAFQWRHAGTNLPGQTAATLLLVGITAADAGAYTVVLTNLSGSVTSEVATLTVIAPTTIVEEDFRVGPGLYSVDVLNFQAVNSGTSGRGFGTRFWEFGEGWSVTAGGLTYAGPAVTGTIGVTSGTNAGHVRANNSSANNTTRLLKPSYILETTTNLWVRFLMDPGTNTGSAGLLLHTHANATGNIASRVGVYSVPAFSPNWLLRINDASGALWDADSGVPVVTNQTALIVLQLLPDRTPFANDTVRLWVNPAGPINSTPPDVVQTGADFWTVGDRFNEVRLAPSGSSRTLIDEIAIALTPENVLTGFVPPPVLSVWIAGNAVKVGWSTNAVGFDLEHTASLNPPNWHPYGAPDVEGTNYVITITNPAGNNFFRLKK